MFREKGSNIELMAKARGSTKSKHMFWEVVVKRIRLNFYLENCICSWPKQHHRECTGRTDLIRKFSKWSFTPLSPTSPQPRITDFLHGISNLQGNLDNFLGNGQ